MPMTVTYEIADRFAIAQIESGEYVVAYAVSRPEHPGYFYVERFLDSQSRYMTPADSAQDALSRVAS